MVPIINESEKTRRLKHALFTAKSYHGDYYAWGGDTPGLFDCSGYVCSILKAMGSMRRKARYNADTLWQKLRVHQVQQPAKGMLVFWFNDYGRAKHVEFCLDQDFSIGASGGGPHVKDKQSAIRANAFVKIRLIASRGGSRRYVNPLAVKIKEPI